LELVCLVCLVYLVHLPGGMSVVDVFVGNFPHIDWSLYSLWVEGLTLPEATARLRERGQAPAPGSLEGDLQASELADSYRLFGLWEGMLHQPRGFQEQLVFQLEGAVQGRLVEEYYALDSPVARELLGRKLTSRLRKDLDEVAEKTGVSLRSCRRQFDNMKRVVRGVEEVQGTFTTNIKAQFLLSDQLAERYSVLVFVACHRLETTKKKLAFLSFEDFHLVCGEVMARWSPEGGQVDDSGEPLLDKDFFYLLRDLKALGEKEKEHRYAVCQALGRAGLPQRTMSEIEANFKALSKAILAIGQSLYSSREVKELFVTVMDKVVEPLKQWRLTTEEVSLLLTTYVSVVVKGTVSLDSSLTSAFQRFMATLTLLITTFHRAATSRSAPA